MQTGLVRNEQGLIHEGTETPFRSESTTSGMSPSPDLRTQNSPGTNNEGTSILTNYEVFRTAVPPKVTAKSWCVMDGHTGEVLFEKRGHERREMASITKMMTCYVVCKIAQRLQLDVKNTMLTVSMTAAKLNGTSARLLEGDILSIQDLLYGLMLPSGNDASVVLAEHFGRFFYNVYSQKRANRAHHQIKPCRNPVKYFLMEMNKFAEILSLTDTHYANSHGLSNSQNKSSAHDCCKLGAIIMQDPYIATIVNAKEYSTRIDNSRGKSRDMTWKNTNRLLPLDGWNGVKTGNTPAASACLTASYDLDGYYMIVTILGARARELRWSETPELLHWTIDNIKKRQLE